MTGCRGQGTSVSKFEAIQAKLIGSRSSRPPPLLPAGSPRSLGPCLWFGRFAIREGRWPQAGLARCDICVK